MDMEDLNELMDKLLDKETINQYGVDYYIIATNALGISSGCMYNKKPDGHILYHLDEEEVNKRITNVINEKQKGKYFHQIVNEYQYN